MIVSGHFRLWSGDHAAHFLRFRRLAAEPEALGRAARILLERAGLPAGERVVLAPESAGGLLADETATRLGAGLALARIDLQRRPTDGGGD